MPLITAVQPDAWEQLEQLAADLLNESGMKAARQVNIALPRGSVDVDVLAEYDVEGVVHRTICECKNWRTNIPREVVHAFRTECKKRAHTGDI